MKKNSNMPHSLKSTKYQIWLPRFLFIVATTFCIEGAIRFRRCEKSLKRAVQRRTDFNSTKTLTERLKKDKYNDYLTISATSAYKKGRRSKFIFYNLITVLITVYSFIYILEIFSYQPNMTIVANNFTNSNSSLKSCDQIDQSSMNKTVLTLPKTVLQLNMSSLCIVGL